MGIAATRLYFKKGLPKVAEIKDKFLELTGLYLNAYVVLHAVELYDNDREIAYRLYKDIEKKNAMEMKDKLNAFDMEQRNKLNRLEGFTFSCYTFHSITLDYLIGKSFYLEYDISSSGSYFSESLIKTMLELGGNEYNFSSSPEPGHVVEDYLETYRPYERRWKKLKKWKKYNDFERPKK